jgi:hypothetical protein
MCFLKMPLAFVSTCKVFHGWDNIWIMIEQVDQNVTSWGQGETKLES